MAIEGTVTVAELASELAAEHDDLDRLVASLDADDWDRPTASPGWTVRDQIGHLTYFDDTARLAIESPDDFEAKKAALIEAMDPESSQTVDDLTLGAFRAMAPDDLLSSWRANRAALIKQAGTLEDKARVPWYGPWMGAKSFLTARLMETWAHGQDVADAVGAGIEPTERLAHIARLGVNTRGWSYVVRGLEPPDEPILVDLTSPAGASWRFGPTDSANRISGSAVDFCLVVTQRRHPDDTDLDIVGFSAFDWMVKAQAFAGGATDGPPASDISS